MRIVITTTLNNNLFRAKLVPLVRAWPGTEVVVVSDRRGPPFEGVRWVWPDGWSAKFGRLGGRLLLLLRETLNARTTLVMAYSVVPHGLFALAVAKLCRKPVFLHFIAGPAELEFAHDLRVTDNRMIARTRHAQWWERFLTCCVGFSDRLLVPGAVTACALQRRGLPAARIVHLHSAVDTQRYHPPADDGQRDVDVIVCAQLRERKRPIFSLEVLAALRQRRDGVRFQWLGDGTMHAAFVSARDRLDLTQALDWTETDDVAPYFRRAKVFLLCSLNEGLSLACLEAMACGCVPVCSSCGDMADAVLDGITGRLLPQHATVADYAGTITALLDDDTRRTALSRAARLHIANRHSFDIAQRAWSALLANYA